MSDVGFQNLELNCHGIDRSPQLPRESTTDIMYTPLPADQAVVTEAEGDAPIEYTPVRCIDNILFGLYRVV